MKLIEQSITPHPGYGAGSGYVIREVYECPCGKGQVIYEKDDIPGFRDSSTYCLCDECKHKYEFDRGEAVKKGSSE